MRIHPRQAEVDISNPSAWATCELCGFIANLRKMNWRRDWRGNQIQNLRQLVCDRCLDEPQRQLGTIILPPDPLPVMNARPEQYNIDEYPVSTLATESGAVLILDGHFAHPVQIIVDVPGNIIDGTL